MKRSFACAAALVAALTAGSGAFAGSSNRQDFLKDAIKGDNSEIRLGRLAARNGGTPAVREYGRTLMTI